VLFGSAAIIRQIVSERVGDGAQVVGDRGSLDFGTSAWALLGLLA
jgi:hypothetical protein